MNAYLAVDAKAPMIRPDKPFVGRPLATCVFRERAIGIACSHLGGRGVDVVNRLEGHVVLADDRGQALLVHIRADAAEDLWGWHGVRRGARLEHEEDEGEHRRDDSADAGADEQMVGVGSH